MRKNSFSTVLLLLLICFSPCQRKNQPSATNHCCVADTAVQNYRSKIAINTFVSSKEIFVGQNVEGFLRSTTSTIEYNKDPDVENECPRDHWYVHRANLPHKNDTIVVLEEFKFCADILIAYSLELRGSKRLKIEDIVEFSKNLSIDTIELTTPYERKVSLDSILNFRIQIENRALIPNRYDSIPVINIEYWLSAT